MNRVRVLELRANLENSRVELKRDDCSPATLAKEMSALLNLEGGVVLLGVEDDGRVSGLTRGSAAAEEWVMNIARQNLQPPVIPVWTPIAMDDGKVVGVVELPADEPGKPYKARRGNAWVTHVRVGTTSREATREEEARLHQAARLIRYELKGVPDTDLEALDLGVIDRTVAFVKRNMGSVAWLDGARRRRKQAFPMSAIREAVVNAVAHRDYGREGTDIEVSLYGDRLEVISPGRLPNGVTVEKMKEGVVRVARNELIREILRDYRYVEHYGMSVRNRIIEGMQKHNGTAPDLLEQDDRFVVRLWKDRRRAT